MHQLARGGGRLREGPQAGSTGSEGVELGEARAADAVAHDSGRGVGGEGAAGAEMRVFGFDIGSDVGQGGGGGGERGKRGGVGLREILRREATVA